jgi:hypothetical protein
MLLNMLFSNKQLDKKPHLNSPLPAHPNLNYFVSKSIGQN